MSSPASDLAQSAADKSGSNGGRSLSARTTRLLLGLIVLWGLVGSGWLATVGLDSTKWWDERYVFANVRPVLAGKGFEPVNGWYPRLSYLPQAGLLALSQAASETTGSERLAVLKPDGSFSPTAYLISRWLNTVFAAGCLIAIYAIGRRLFSRPVGLMAALLLSMTPWHIHAAAVFKPDPLLLLLMSLTFYWSLDAVEKGTLGTYLLCGAGVGLAASAKTPGAFAAIPLVALSLLEPRSVSRWLKLVAAGMASIAVFWLVNGRLFYYLDHARREQSYLTESYPEQSFVDMLRWAATTLGDWSFHGPVLGPVALLGFVGLAVLLARRWNRRTERLRLAMFLSPVLIYPLAISALSDYTKGNYLMPLLPFTTIAAAWILSLTWRSTAGRLRASPRWILLWLAVLALVALAGRQGVRYVYRGGVPDTTTSLIARYIAATAPVLNHSVVVYEGGVGELRPKIETPRWLTVAVTREARALSDVPASELDRADYEVFLKDRLEGPDRRFYLARTSRLDSEQVIFFEPKPFSVRGTAQVLLAHPWRLVGRTLPLEQTGPDRKRKRSLRARIPVRVHAGEMISLDLGFAEFSPPSRIQQECKLSFDRSPLEVFPYQVHGDVERWMTKRFVLSRRRAEVELRCARKSEHLDRLSVLDVVRWASDPPATP